MEQFRAAPSDERGIDLCRKWMLPIGLLSLIFVLAACSSGGIESITTADIPDEPAKNDTITSIKNATNLEMDSIIEAHFPHVYTVDGNGGTAKVYATQHFQLTELSSLLAETIEPMEISDVKDNQQILIYSDEFITLRESESDQDVLLIEVASDEFVKQNYSPNFLSTYFAIRILDDVLDVDDWGRRSRGTYSGMGSLDTPSRGNTSFRGGGPGSGK